MIGGWMSFAGTGGKAKFHDTPLEEALPVTCLPYDDRQERPEGATPRVMDSEHPIFARMPGEWPFFLGYNKVMPREEARTLLKFERDPLLSVWEYGRGRAAAFTSDCVGHWGPPQFVKWEFYATFWDNLMRWLSRS
jgi:uncharacterized membrane protein